MDSRSLGVAIALSASALFAVGASLQAIEARTTSRREAFRLSLLWRLLSRPRWVVGTTIAALGWPVQILALTLAPLALVQSVDAIGLLLLLVIGSRALGESVGRREYLAVGGIIVGVGGLASAAPPHSTAQSGGLPLAVALIAIAAGALAPYMFRRRRPPALAEAASAGMAFAGTAFATKLISNALSTGSLFPLALWLPAAGLLVAAGTVTEASALQRAPATRVIPTVYVVELIVPVALVALTTGEAPQSITAAMTLGAFLTLVAASVAMLGGSRPIAMMAGGVKRPPHPRGRHGPTSCADARASSADPNPKEGGCDLPKTRAAPDRRRAPEAAETCVT